MKIFKIKEFLLEGFQDPPEEWVKNELIKLKKRINGIFIQSEVDIEEDIEPGDIKKMSDALEDGKVETGTLSEMGVQLVDSTISVYSSQYDSLKVIFTDGVNRYDLFITIPLKEAMKTKDKNGEYKIKDCFIKFKKYDLDLNLLGTIPPKKVKISDINEDFFISLKIDIDELDE